jgi:hypothetical protein
MTQGLFQIFYAFQVYLSPQSFSLTSVALIQQASSSLTWTFYSIFREEKSFRQRLEEMRTISELGKIQNTLEDGELHYPEDVLKPSPGMEVKFQQVPLLFCMVHQVLTILLTMFPCIEMSPLLTPRARALSKMCLSPLERVKLW